MEICQENADQLQKSAEILDRMGRANEKTYIESTTGFRIRESSLLKCPWPKMQQKYAPQTGECWIYYMKCRNLCPYAVKTEFSMATGCGYGKKEKDELSGVSENESGNSARERV